MRHVLAALLAAVLGLGLAVPAAIGADVEYFGDANELVLRSNDLLACDRELREATTGWPRLYAGLPRQGLAVAHDAADLRTEAGNRHREFRDTAKPFLALLSASGDLKAEHEAAAAVKQNFVAIAARLASICWTFELRQAQLEIDSIRHAYLSTPALASFRARETEIFQRTGGGGEKFDLEFGQLIAEVTPHEIEARKTALAAYGAVTGRLLERRRVLAGSLKSLVRNLHEIEGGYATAFRNDSDGLDAAHRLRAANYRLFAIRLAELPAEEVRRIFGPDENRALLVSALDAFHLMPGPQDVLHLPVFATIGAEDTYKMNDAFEAAPFAGIAPYNYRPMESYRPGALVIEAGPLTMVSPAAGP